MKVRLIKSPKGDKKFRAIFVDSGKFVDFGGKGYSDYTIHKDRERMMRYLVRHRRRETWTRAGMYTPGFWSRWLLWSYPTMEGAKRLMTKKFGLKIVHNS
jgi:hypothetical protein